MRDVELYLDDLRDTTGLSELDVPQVRGAVRFALWKAYQDGIADALHALPQLTVSERARMRSSLSGDADNHVDVVMIRDEPEP